MGAVEPGGGLATKYSKEHFGGTTSVNVNPVSSVVGTVPTQLLANNPERVGWIIVNRDANPIGLAFANAVSLTGQLLLGGGGSILSLHIEDDGELVTFPVWAISATGNATVYVLEVTAG